MRASRSLEAGLCALRGALPRHSNYCVCSTRNVPPQRRDWWAYDAARKAPRGLGDLPPELFDEVIKNVNADGMLDADELEEVRDAMRRERRENAAAIRETIGRLDSVMTRMISCMNSSRTTA